MPRAYRMGERAAAMEATRARILEAAIELAIEHGISAVTLRALAERGDVALGTLRRHFPSRDALAVAMAERLAAEVPLPDASIYDGASTLEERLRRLMQAAGRFLDQATRLYAMWLREPMLAGPWAEVGAAYGTRWNELIAEALGPLRSDAEAVAVLRAMMQPTFFDGLRGTKSSTSAVADLAAAVVGPWLRQRVRAREPRHASPRDGTRARFRARVPDGPS